MGRFRMEAGSQGGAEQWSGRELRRPWGRRRGQPATQQGHLPLVHGRSELAGSESACRCPKARDLVKLVVWGREHIPIAAWPRPPRAAPHPGPFRPPRPGYPPGFSLASSSWVPSLGPEEGRAGGRLAGEAQGGTVGPALGAGNSPFLGIPESTPFPVRRRARVKAALDWRAVGVGCLVVFLTSSQVLILRRLPKPLPRKPPAWEICRGCGRRQLSFLPGPGGTARDHGPPVEGADQPGPGT